MLSTAFKRSSMWWIENCSRIISLYRRTELPCNITIRQLTGQQTLYLYTPSSDRVDMSRIKDLWSPGLSAKLSMERLTSPSGVLYPPSIGDLGNKTECERPQNSVSPHGCSNQLQVGSSGDQIQPLVAEILDIYQGGHSSEKVVIPAKPLGFWRAHENTGCGLSGLWKSNFSVSERQ